MAKEGKKILVAQFVNAINVGGDMRFSIDSAKQKAELEKTATGLWIRREGWGDKWVPDSNLKWFECEKTD
jgi:hypothetical protein